MRIGVLLLLLGLVLPVQAEEDSWISVVGEFFLFPDISSEPVDSKVVLPPPGSLHGLSNSTAQRLVLNKIVLQGNTRLAEKQVEEALQPFIGIPLGNGELYLIAAALTELYISRGYVHARVIVPDQKIVESTLVLKSIEGHIEDISLAGLKRIQPESLEAALARHDKHVFNYYDVLQSVDELQNDPRIQQVNVKVSDIDARLASRLLISVTETPRYAFTAGLNNYKSPAIGSTQAFVQGRMRGLVSSYDTVSLRAGLTAGVLEGLFRYGHEYSHTDLALFYQRSQSSIIDEAVRELNIQHSMSAFGVTAIGSLSRQRSLSKGWQWQTQLVNKTALTTIDGVPVSLVSTGPDARSSVANIGLGVRNIQRGAEVDQLLGLDIVFSAGLGSALKNAWIIQPAYTHQRRFDWLSSRLSLLARGQISSSSLLPTDLFAVGGVHSVRGYSENSHVGDQGGLLRTDWSLLPLSMRKGRLNWGPFLDLGYVRYIDLADSETVLSSTGLSIRFDGYRRQGKSGGLTLQLDWGLPLLRDAEKVSRLQSAGLHASVSYSL